MNNIVSRRDLEKPPWPMAEPHPGPPRPELDVVRDNTELVGKFPPDVAIDFIYAEPGDSKANGVRAAEAARLAPYCLGADIIARQTNLADPDYPSQAWLEYQKINDYIGVSFRNKTPPETLAALARWSDGAFGAIGACTALTIAMLRLGRTSQPQFVPLAATRPNPEPRFSEYASPANLYNAIDINLRRKARQDAASQLERDTAVIRQLRDQAVLLDLDGLGHQIAVIDSPEHTATSVAVDRFGAPTSRVILDKPIISVTDQLARQLRYHRPEEIDEAGYFERAATAVQFQLSVMWLARKLKVRDAVRELGKDATATARVGAGVGRLCLQAQTGTLPKAAATELADQREHIEPFLDSTRKVPTIQRWMLGDAAQRIIELGQTVT